MSDLLAASLEDSGTICCAAVLALDILVVGGSCDCSKGSLPVFCASDVGRVF